MSSYKQNSIISESAKQEFIIKEEPKSSIQDEIQLQDNEELSFLSFSSYDSLDNINLENMGQYTCDECSQIPKIISTNLEKKTILIKCKNHGQKELNINDYLINSLKYNPNNWKCADSEHVQKECKELFKNCECGSVFCAPCFEHHKEIRNHNKFIDSSQFFLQCKNPDHFGTKFSGYCQECDENFCENCIKNHQGHTKIQNSNMEVDQKEIEKIKKLNKEYRTLISYYESLIRLNNLILYSYEKNRGNYYNLYNINRILANIKRKEIINSLKDNTSNNDFDNNTFNQIIVPGEKNSNFNNYIKDLYNQQLKEEETIEFNINDKFFNNLDLKILTQIPLYNLKMLNLDNNGITKIDSLENAEFPELILLSMKNNAINDISVLEKVKFLDLQGLFLSNNCIKDISVFGKIKFKQLRLIDLRNNIIEDIKVFEIYETNKLTVLESIYLSGNKFDINKFSTVKQLLEKCNECLL